MSVADAKQALREKYLAARDLVPEITRIEHALDAAEHGITQLSDRLAGRVVAAYHPIRSEIDPRVWMAQLATCNARLALPVVLPGSRLAFRALERSASLVAGAFGTAHPGPDAEELRPTALIMPLAVFDDRGGRIGYGAGYYDRAIAELSRDGQQPLLIGLAFDEQRAPEVPQEPHDRRLDFVVTPSGITDCRP